METQVMRNKHPLIEMSDTMEVRMLEVMIIENPEVQPQDDDNKPDYSIASIDCIESQHSGEDYDLDIGTGQRPQDHSHDSEQVAAHDRGPSMPPGATGAAQRSICEEVNESDDSPEAGLPL
jgi:hypothetical protein